MGRTNVVRRSISKLLIVVVLACTGLVAFAPASWASPTHAAEELGFVSKINAERAKLGLNSLTVNLQLTGVARAWSDRMAADGRISHNPDVAAQVEGDWTRLGENVGFSSRTATTGEEFVERLHVAFMNSPGHRANVVGDFNQIGVGVRTTPETMWVTVNFTKARTVTPNGTVNEAAQVADQVFGNGTGRAAEYVVVAASDNPGHALGAAALAGDRGPLLYTHPATSWDPNPVLHPTTRAAIDRTMGGDGIVYVVGNAKSVSDVAVAELVEDGYTVKRLVGPSEEATLVRVAEETVRRRGDNDSVIIANADAWGSSVAAAVWAAQSGTPVLVTSRTSLHPSVKAFLAKHTPTKRWVVGSAAIISKPVKIAADARRIGGRTSAAVSVNVAKRLWGRTVAANGDRWASTPGADSRGWAYTLAHAPWSAVNDGPALLVDNTSVPAAVAGYLTSLEYGGTIAGHVQAAGPVPAPVVSRVETLVGAS